MEIKKITKEARNRKYAKKNQLIQEHQRSGRQRTMVIIRDRWFKSQTGKNTKHWFLYLKKKRQLELSRYISSVVQQGNWICASHDLSIHHKRGTFQRSDQNSEDDFGGVQKLVVFCQVLRGCFSVAWLKSFFCVINILEILKKMIKSWKSCAHFCQTL